MADQLVIDLARELYDRFVMGGWEPQDAYPMIERMLAEPRLPGVTRCLAHGNESCEVCIFSSDNQQSCEAERAPEPEGTRTDTGQLGEAMTEILLMLMEERLLAATSGQHELFERLGKMTWLAERAIGREDAGSPAERQEPSKLHNAGSSPASPSTFVAESPSSASEQENKNG